MSRTLSRAICGKRSIIPDGRDGEWRWQHHAFKSCGTPFLCGHPIIVHCSKIGNVSAPFSIQPDKAATLLTWSCGGTCSLACRSRNATNVTDSSVSDVSAAPKIEVTLIVLCLRLVDVGCAALLPGFVLERKEWFA